MITLECQEQEYVLTPTIFPDGTSQVWKLPEYILNDDLPLDVIWHFDSEREIIDLLSLKKLLGPEREVNLHIPYLPYGRQDKDVKNDCTFNLAVLADLLNSAQFNTVSSVDTHSTPAAIKLINNFTNVPVTRIHMTVIDAVRPDFVVFPDKGAKDRYSAKIRGVGIVTCDKVRDQSTGNITGHTLLQDMQFSIGTKFLIVDDICDGGATFISIAKMLYDRVTNVHVDLFVTHGIFSKGKEVLHNSGIKNIYTTNSLTKNDDGYEV
jgi:ribose-phosphate pyrophosphokinase